MNPRRTITAAACALAAAATLTLTATGPANATAGLTTATFASSDHGNLDLQLTYECDGGGTGTLLGAALENLVVGTGSMSVACDGSAHSVSLPVVPVSGSFTTPGTATISAALVDASNVTVATLPPTSVNVF